MVTKPRMVLDRPEADAAVDRRSRAYRLYRVGCEAITTMPRVGYSESELALMAIAAMLAEATKKPTPKAKPKSLVAPRVAFEIIRASGAVDCDPVDQRWFGRLGKELAMLQLTEADLGLIADYLSCGGWKGERPTFGKIIKWLPELAARAKGQPLPEGKSLSFV